MSELVRLALAGDVNEAVEMQALLEEAGIGSSLEPEDEADAIVVLVPAMQLEEAQEAILALTEPDDLIADA